MFCPSISNSFSLPPKKDSSLRHSREVVKKKGLWCHTDLVWALVLSFINCMTLAEWTTLTLIVKIWIIIVSTWPCFWKDTRCKVLSTVPGTNKCWVKELLLLAIRIFCFLSILLHLSLKKKIAGVNFPTLTYMLNKWDSSLASCRVSSEIPSVAAGLVPRIAGEGLFINCPLSPTCLCPPAFSKPQVQAASSVSD